MHMRLALLLLPLSIAGASSSAGAEELLGHTGKAPTPMVTGNAIASLALANVGGMACAANSLGGHAFGIAKKK